jgi:coenzyme F420 biosynthesis associated uncharacterized protein
MIDWGLARRLAAYTGGSGTLSGGYAAELRLREQLNELAPRAEQAVVEYTGMVPGVSLPAPEAVDRRSWAELNIDGMRPMLEPLTKRIASPGRSPIAGVTAAVGGFALSAEVGVLVGLLSQRVLGQYDLALLDADRPPRLLFVAPNLEQAVNELRVDHDEFLAWVTLHEVTHAVQFTSVPWLREHVGGMVRELISSLEVRIDNLKVTRLPSLDDLRSLASALRELDLVRVATTPQQRELIDRIQATMAVIEGHAEHVMDAAAGDMLPSLPALRSSLEKRRSSTRGVMKIVQRLIGLDLKLRQYEIGKRFCDALVEEGGIEHLNRVWESPEALPTLAELDDPARWGDRTRVPPVTKS